MTPVEIRRSFIEAVYVRDFKNCINNIYFAVDLLIEKSSNHEIVKECLSTLGSEIPRLEKMFNENLEIIVNAIREYKEMESDCEEYLIVSEIWTKHLPKLIK